MAMRDHDRVELGQIDVELIDVVLENLGVVSAVEQNAPTVVLDQCGESPVHCQCRGWTESVVEERDPLFALRLRAEGIAQRNGQTEQEKNASRHDVLRKTFETVSCLCRERPRGLAAKQQDEVARSHGLTPRP